MSKIKVAVIGCGVICHNHLIPLSNMPNIEIAAVCDIKPQKAEAVAKEFGCKYYTDYEEMIEKERPDSVHVCLPHYLHAKAAVYCMQHGADVLCEKPMDITLAAAKEMARVHEKTGKKLGIIFQNRYNSGSVFLKSKLDAGKLGKVLGVTAEMMWLRDQSYYDLDAWRGKWKTEGGGVLINQSIHTLDLMRYFAGGEVVSVSASAAHRGDTTVEVEDVSEGRVSFSNGVTAIYYFTNNSAIFLPPCIHVLGKNGHAVVTGSDAVIHWNDGRTEHSPHEEAIKIGKDCYGGSHAFQIADFYGENGEARAQFMLDEALKTQALLEEIYNCAGVRKL